MTERPALIRQLSTLLAALLLIATFAPILQARNVVAQDDPLQVVATTTQATDLALNIGGDLVEVEGIMEAGVDPHLYRASEGDLTTMLEAEVILYNGLNLEGQMADVLVQLAQDRPVVSLGVAIPEEQRLNVPKFESEYDPHFWFDPTLWAIAAQATANAFAEADPDNAATYEENAAAYIAELEALDAEAMTALSAIPEDQRVLVTAHDAFGYFGNRYGIEVIGIQGLSTETEAGIADLQRVADTIIQRNIPALFVESTISPATIEAVQAAVADRGGNVVIGGQLYSDAMGEAGTPEGTYLGMFRYNVNTIVAAYTGTSSGTPVATPAT